MRLRIPLLLLSALVASSCANQPESESDAQGTQGKKPTKVGSEPKTGMAGNKGATQDCVVQTITGAASGAAAGVHAVCTFGQAPDGISAMICNVPVGIAVAAGGAAGTVAGTVVCGGGAVMQAAFNFFGKAKAQPRVVPNEDDKANNWYLVLNRAAVAAENYAVYAGPNAFSHCELDANWLNIYLTHKLGRGAEFDCQPVPVPGIIKDPKVRLRRLYGTDK